MKLLLDFFPVVAFFVAYQIADIYVATATIMVAMVFQIIVLKKQIFVIPVRCAESEWV